MPKPKAKQQRQTAPACHSMHNKKKKVNGGPASFGKGAIIGKGRGTPKLHRMDAAKAAQNAGGFSLQTAVFHALPHPVP